MKTHWTYTGYRKFLFIAAFSLICTSLFAPGNHTVTIAASQSINPYYNLLKATAMVETLGNPMAYNEEENAVGLLQIRQVRIDDYNRRTGSNLSLSQMFDVDLSIRVFMYYASLESPKNLEKISKAWNGSGPMTELYWLRIKEYL
ncbi:MAG: transglycosylase SLT domain-containing protein [Bacteroidales bacterium]|nr:transglycosylase SLT domain-containing protein [Bacteroidales bacterium]